MYELNNWSNVQRSENTSYKLKSVYELKRMQNKSHKIYKQTVMEKEENYKKR